VQRNDFDAIWAASIAPRWSFKQADADLFYASIGVCQAAALTKAVDIVAMATTKKPTLTDLVSTTRRINSESRADEVYESVPESQASPEHVSALFAFVEKITSPSLTHRQKADTIQAYVDDAARFGTVWTPGQLQEWRRLWKHHADLDGPVPRDKTAIEQMAEVAQNERAGQ